MYLAVIWNNLIGWNVEMGYLKVYEMNEIEFYILFEYENILIWYGPKRVSLCQQKNRIIINITLYYIWLLYNVPKIRMNSPEISVTVRVTQQVNLVNSCPIKGLINGWLRSPKNISYFQRYSAKLKLADLVIISFWSYLKSFNNTKGFFYLPHFNLYNMAFTKSKYNVYVRIANARKNAFE